MRHGAEPWTELAVKLMLKYPNLYYGDMAFDINDNSNPVTLKFTTCDTSGNYFESTIIIE